jgi:hypothetical protein
MSVRKRPWPRRPQKLSRGSTNRQHHWPVVWNMMLNPDVSCVAQENGGEKQKKKPEAAK